MPDQVVRETYEPEAYVIAAVVQGNWERALELIDEFGPSPAYAPHFAGVAVRLLAAKRRPEAVRVASRAVELDDECADAHSVLGRSLLEELKQSAAQAGDEQAVATGARAETALRRAMLLAPEALPSRIALAGLYTDQNRLFEAARLIEEAFSLDSQGPDAREALKRLRKAVETALKQKDGSELHVSNLDTSGNDAVPVRHELIGLGDELRRLAARLHQSGGAARTPSVSLCLITRDEARNLPRVIESVRGLVTEIVVVDTGSTDDTVRIAERLKARVEYRAWDDDFAAVRNHSLSLATGDWILVLDADDEFASDSIPFLKQWLSRDPAAEVVALYRRYPSPGMLRDSVSVQPRLFRNRRGLRFKGAIHEELVTPDGNPVRPDVTLTATIYHHGAIDGPNATARRRERNSRILLRVLEREPDDLRCRFYLGLTHFEGERWSDAIPCLQAVVDQVEETLDYLPKAYACLGNALLNAHRPSEAEAMIRAGLERFPVHPELWFCLGLACDHLGRLEEAVAANESALRGRFGPSLNWHDWACWESKPHLALCDLKLTLGDTEGAARHLSEAERFTGPEPAYAQIREAIARTEEERARLAVERQRSLEEHEVRFRAGDPASGARMVDIMLAEGQIERADSVVKTWIGSSEEEPWALIAQGNVQLARGLPVQALDCFERSREAGPDRLEAWLGAAASLKAMGRCEEAEAILGEASRRFSQSQEINRALGELALERARWDEAARCFQDCLEQHGADWAAWLGLGKALLRSGYLPQALNCYQRAASLAGGGAAVRIALGEARELLARQTPAPA